MRFRLFSLLIAIMFLFSSCDDEQSQKGIQDVVFRVSYTKPMKLPRINEVNELTYQTPEKYIVALKKATLKAQNTNDDFVLFEASKLSESLVFDFTDKNVVHSLLDGMSIPESDYQGIEIEIYYLQMELRIATSERGVEHRNFRIYLSDDAELENGLHQPGDITQINDGKEIGWLLGEGQTPNFDPVTPRVSAYTHSGDGVSWYSFAGKPGEHYGPFGDVEFMNSAPKPIYKTMLDFNFVDNGGTRLVMDFNVNNCWAFEDKSGDGFFGSADLDAANPTDWSMQMPVMTVTQE